MICPFCGQPKSRVVDSREAPDGIRRRRGCLECSHRFTTYERVNAIPLMIFKRDGRRESFETEKLHRSIRIACAKRPLAVGLLDKLVIDVENELYRLGKAEVGSRIIGEMVMERLRNLDRVAYIRFASVYRDFDDINTFAVEVQALQAEESDELGLRDQLRLIPDDVPRLKKSSRRRQSYGLSTQSRHRQVSVD